MWKVDTAVNVISYSSFPTTLNHAIPISLFAVQGEINCFTWRWLFQWIHGLFSNVVAVSAVENRPNLFMFWKCIEVVRSIMAHTGSPNATVRKHFKEKHCVIQCRDINLVQREQLYSKEVYVPALECCFWGPCIFIWTLMMNAMLCPFLVWILSLQPATMLTDSRRLHL